MIILLNYTIESRFAHIIKQQTNTPENLQIIEQQYSQLGTENAYQYMIGHVINNPDLYGEDVSSLVREGRYNEAATLTTNNKRTMLHFGYMFDSVYQKAFANLSKTSSKLTITLPYNTTKPSNVDLFIGWASSEYEVEHMEEHEGIHAAQGYDICNAHNQWMIENSSTYDVFFNGNSHQDVIDYINKL